MAPAIPSSRKRPTTFGLILSDWNVDENGHATEDTNYSVCSSVVPPNDRYYIRTDWSDTHYYAAHCPGESGEETFYDTNESAAADTLRKVFGRECPAVVHPRTNWDHWDPNHPIRYPIFGNSVDREAVASKVPPSSGFTESGTTTAWATHCSTLCVLLSQMRQRTNTTVDGLQSLLHMTAYGINDVLAVGKVAIRLNAIAAFPNHPNAPNHEDLLPSGVERVSWSSDASGLASQGKVDWRRLVQHRRFYTTLVYHEDHAHWTVLLWDRLIGHLHAFDTYNLGRQQRFKAIVLAWREWLALCGLPFDFNAYGHPLTHQAESWECAILAIVAMRKTIRGLTGALIFGVTGITSGIGLRIDGQLTWPRVGPGLPYRDWVPTPEDITDPASIEKSRDEVIALTEAWILDEIGVKDLKYSASQQGKKGGCTSKHASIPSAAAVQVISLPKPPFKLGDIWSREGGFNHICLTRLGPQNNWGRRRAVVPDPNDGLFRTSKPARALGALRPTGSVTKKRLQAKYIVNDGVPYPKPAGRSATTTSSAQGQQSNRPPTHTKRPSIPQPPELSDQSQQSSQIGKKALPTSKRREAERAIRMPPAKAPRTSTAPALSSLSMNTQPPREADGNYIPSSSSSPSLSSPGNSSSQPPVFPTATQKNRNGAKATAKGQGSSEKAGGAKVRVKRAARTEDPPLITGATLGVYTPDPDDENEEMRATVKQLGNGTRAMCYAPGSWNMARNESRFTSTLPYTGTFATHIPDGLMPASAWDKILAEAARPFQAQSAQVMSRAERMAARKK